MSATDRHRTEQHFHDRQARERRAYFRQHPQALQVEDNDYLDHETWIRFAVDQLGDVSGLRVLDYGCGHGMASVLLARRGALVTAFDLSPWYLEEAVERAGANGVAARVHFVQAVGEQLPFADASFDRIWGNAILHHLDLDLACPELARVLKPGGLGVFCEPWGENVLLELARQWLPYPGKERSPDERPLRRRDLAILRRYFTDVDSHPFQLFGMARRLLPGAAVLPALDRCDAAMLRRWPGLGRFCRYLVLGLRR